jgi:hypothetical protein
MRLCITSYFDRTRRGRKRPHISTGSTVPLVRRLRRIIQLVCTGTDAHEVSIAGEGDGEDADE